MQRLYSLPDQTGKRSVELLTHFAGREELNILPVLLGRLKVIDRGCQIDQIAIRVGRETACLLCLKLLTGLALVIWNTSQRAVDTSVDS